MGEEEPPDALMSEVLYTNSDFEDLPEDDQPNCLARGTALVQNGLTSCLKRNRKSVKLVVICILVALYLAYFIWAGYCKFNTEEDIRLVWMTGFAIFVVTVHCIHKYWGDKMNLLCNECRLVGLVCWPVLKWILLVLVLGFIIFYIIYFVGLKDPYNLVSLAGVFALVIIGYLCSHNPKRIIWRPILWGLLLQFFFALLILRTRAGYSAFYFLGERVAELLTHTDAGSKFLFGDLYMNHFFAFKVRQ